MTTIFRYSVTSLILVCLAGQGLAQTSAAEFDEAVVMRAVEAVVAEHRIYATCSSLDKTGLSVVVESWRKEVDRAVEFLQTKRPSAAFAARFAIAVDFSNLLDRDARLSAVIDLCHRAESERAIGKFYEFGYTRLSDAMEAAVQASTK